MTPPRQAIVRDRALVVASVRWAPLLVAVLGFCLVAAAAAARSGHAASPLRAPHPPGIALDAVIAIGLLVLLGSYALLVVVFWPTRRGGPDDMEHVEEPLQTAWWERPLALLMVGGPLVALLVIAYLTRGPRRQPPPALQSGVAQGLSRLRSPGTHTDATGVDLRWVALIAGVVIAVLASLAVIALVIRRRGAATAILDPVRRRDRARSGAIDPRAETDPRRSVQAAYAAMEQQLSELGVERHEAEAPREYLTRLRARGGSGLAGAEQLTELFERARWSEAAMTSRDRLAALDALDSGPGGGAGQDP